MASLRMEQGRYLFYAFGFGGQLAIQGFLLDFTEHVTFRSGFESLRDCLSGAQSSPKRLHETLVCL